MSASGHHTGEFCEFEVEQIVRPIFTPIRAACRFGDSIVEGLDLNRSLRPNVRGVIPFPVVDVATGEFSRIVDLDRQLGIHARTDVESQPGVGLPAAGQNQHHGPVCTAERAGESLLIGEAWNGAIARMRMDPDSGELFRATSGIDLNVEEIGDRFVVKRHVRPSADLLDQRDVFDEQQIVGRRDAETADFRLALIS